jgi:integrase/recombinase XerC/integrase/recombinase XerD
VHRLDRDRLLEPKDWEKVQAVLASVNPRDALLVHILVLTGLRRSEAAALTWDDLHIDAEPPYLVVRSGKGDKRRNVLIGQECLNYARLCRGLWHSRGWVFPSRKGGGHISGGQAERIVKAIGVKAGVPSLHAHALRHYYATETYGATKDLRFVQVQLGHESIRTTQMYLDLFFEEGARYVAAAEARILGEARP